MSGHNIKELIEHLTDYQQADADGIMVLTSRQACDMAAQVLREIQPENECLQRARDAMEWIRTDTTYKAPEQITVGLLTAYIAKLEAVLTKKKDIGVSTMQQYMKFLGKKVQDKVTGVEGTVTSISFDLNGCVQAIVKQRVNKDGKVPDSTWHDVKRLDIIPGNQVMSVPNFGFMPVGSEAGPEDKPVPD